MLAAIQTLVDTGRVVDIVLVVLGIELLGLALWRRNAGRAMGLGILIASALPGVFLLLALRAALTDAGSLWVAGWLAASFPAHLLDMTLRRP